MKFSYSLKRLLFNLILGLAWLVISYSSWNNSSGEKWYIYGTIVLGILHVGMFFMEWLRKYVEVKESSLSINSWSSKKMNFSDIQKIDSFKEGFVFHGKEKEVLQVRKSQMNKEDYKRFSAWVEEFKVVQ